MQLCSQEYYITFVNSEGCYVMTTTTSAFVTKHFERATQIANTSRRSFNSSSATQQQASSSNGGLLELNKVTEILECGDVSKVRNIGLL